ncbi:MAG: leucine-rich repeat domain-containing protein [Lachnospiraceae bacterium]|nr:leucine-rich repeat domain-containing protein [Lachnospiraceae bacterium]
MKKAIILILCVLLLAACQNKGKSTNTEQSTRTPDSIVGTWYQLKSADYVISWYFGEDNTFEIIDDYYGDVSIHSGSYVIEDSIVTMTRDNGGGYGKYRIKYTDYGFKLMYAEKAGRPLELHENKQKLIESAPNYYTSITYYKTIADKNGYVIEDGVLIEYIGEAKSITIPSKVKSIESGSFSRVRNLDKITFPETIKIIPSHVIGVEGSVSYVYIKDGVQEIEDYAFWDAYLLELHIPSSVTKIGKDIIGVVEGGISEETTIYVEKDSYAHQYFVKEGLEEQLVFEEPENIWVKILIITVVVVLVIGVSVAIAIVVKKKRK